MDLLPSILLVRPELKNCTNHSTLSDKFTLESTLTSPITADIIGTIGYVYSPISHHPLSNTHSHVHDGGVTTSLHVDGKQLACQSDAQYGTTPDFVSAGMDMPGMQTHAAVGTMKHVSTMGLCTMTTGLNIKKIEKGQKWVLKADYDFGKWPGMKGEDGKWDEVMGIRKYMSFPFVIELSKLLGKKKR